MVEGIVDKKNFPVKESEAIIDKIAERGWNVYEITGSALGSLEFIEAGPATRLETGKRYTMLPAVENPKDPAQVALTFMAVIKRLDWNLPTIELNNTRQASINSRYASTIFSCGIDLIYPTLSGKNGSTEREPYAYLSLLETLPSLTSPKTQQDIKSTLRTR